MVGGWRCSDGVIDNCAAHTGPHRGFQRRGFIYGCWVMNHPFSGAVPERQDFAAMFQLLRHLGYNTVVSGPPEQPPCRFRRDAARAMLAS
jgi:hypothetical protein